MLTQTPSTAALIDLVQGKSHSLDILVDDPDGVAYDFTSGYVASMNLRERVGGDILSTLTSAGGEIVFSDSAGAASTATISITEVGSIVGQVGYLDIDGWRVNLWDAGETTSPGGTTLYFDYALSGGMTWADVFDELASLINTGALVNGAIFSLPGDPATAHPSVSATSTVVGSNAVLTITADTVGSAANLVTYNFVDSINFESSSGKLSGGTNFDTNVILLIDSAATTAILSNSVRPTGYVHIIGDMAIDTTGGESEHLFRLDFKFRQTT